MIAEEIAGRNLLSTRRNHGFYDSDNIDCWTLAVYTVFMKTAMDTIIAEVLSLSPQARAFVAEKLIESLDAEPEVTLSAAWREEVRRRCDEIDRGTVKLRDAGDVFASAYAALG